jgi:hypothetical protein
MFRLIFTIIVVILLFTAFDSAPLKCPEDDAQALIFLTSITDTTLDQEGWLPGRGGAIRKYQDSIDATYAGNVDFIGPATSQKDFSGSCTLSDGSHKKYFMHCKRTIGPSDARIYPCLGTYS